MKKEIFVYGSLMEGFWNYQKSLEGHILEKRVAYVNGKLYHMPYKGYPALISGDDLVKGELMMVDNFEEIEEILSEIENFYGKDDSRNEYDVKDLVILDESGVEIAVCPVYFYNEKKDPLFNESAIYLPKGSWKSYMLENGYFEKLTKDDEQHILAYANQNPVTNLFILGDLKQFGFDKDFQTFHGVKKDGNLDALMMRYCNSLCIYANTLTKSDIHYIENQVRLHEIKNINLGEKTYDIWKKTAPDFVGKVIETTIATYESTSESNIEATVEELDFTEIAEFLAVGETIFGKESAVKEQFASEVLSGAIRPYVIKSEGKIVTVATVTAISDNAAMLIGVGTLKEYRGHGYATDCVRAIAQELQKNGIIATLFYSDPTAGKIYKKIGFKDFEKYYLIEV